MVPTFLAEVDGDSRTLRTDTAIRTAMFAWRARPAGLGLGLAGASDELAPGAVDSGELEPAGSTLPGGTEPRFDGPDVADGPQAARTTARIPIIACAARRRCRPTRITSPSPVARARPAPAQSTTVWLCSRMNCAT